jgi:hypothetical protein
MTSLNDLAPYPTRVEDVTADSLARHFTVQAAAHAHDASVMCREATTAGGNANWGPYNELVEHLFVEFGVVLLLRTVAHKDVDQADELARDLFSQWDAADLHDWLFEWMVEYGIDPEQVKALAAADRSETLKAAS